jgi:hypothetical protein
MDPRATEAASSTVTERRISWLTLLFGLIAGFLVVLFRDRLWGLGLAIGAALAWLNFRWLGRGLDALVLAFAAQAGAARPRVPFAAYFLAVFRYALLGFAVYVIFKFLKVPLVSMIVGWCALGAAALAASVYEILRPAE